MQILSLLVFGYALEAFRCNRTADYKGGNPLRYTKYAFASRMLYLSIICLCIFIASSGGALMARIISWKEELFFDAGVKSMSVQIQLRCGTIFSRSVGIQMKWTRFERHNNPAYSTTHHPSAL